MKQQLILLFLLFVAENIAFGQIEIASCCRGCTGSANCTACKNCSGCNHCAKNGGTCGTCSNRGRIQIVPSPPKIIKDVSPTKNRNDEVYSNIDTYSSIIEAPFIGKIREKAKTSIASGVLKKFESVSDFMEWLPTDGYMYGLEFRSNSIRKEDENYNIMILKTSVLKIELENDNDIHITICDWQDEYTPINILTVEVSGLPDVKSRDYEKLLNARRQFYEQFPKFIGRKYFSYKTRTSSPKVALSGSLFFDYYHSKENNTSKYSSKTSFEIHPIVEIIRIDNK